MGPAPCLISKENKDYLWNLYFKGPQLQPMQAILEEALKDFKKSRTSLTLDVDPR